MIKIILLSLLPLTGTSIGAYLGIAKCNKQIDNQEDSLVAVATGILGAICVNLFFETFNYVRDIKLFVGIMTGVLFILLMNKITNREALHSQLFWAMLIHNIPEGIIVGFALANKITIQKIGIIASVSLQNIPDGLVVSMSGLPKHGKSKAFWLGVLSGIVEPIAVAVIISFTKKINMSMVEPIFIGFSVSAIVAIEYDLLKNCQKLKLLLLSFITTLTFNGILG